MTCSSATEPVTAAFVSTTYVWPAMGGTWDVMVPLSAEAGIDVVLRPLIKVTNVGPDVAAVVSSVMTVSAPTLEFVAVRAGKALKGSAALLVGHDLMKAEARVKTSLAPSGVPCGLAAATRPTFSRSSAVWRDSVTRVEPATVRMSLLWTKGAAPR